MSNYIKDYSPYKTTSSWGGILMEGVAEGTFISMSRNSPRTEVTTGAKGDSGITVSADRSGTVEVTLLQNSPTNQYLSGIVNAEDLDYEVYRSDFIVTDPSGSVLAVAKRAHIQEGPSIDLGDGQNSKVWMFFTEDLQYLPVPVGMLESETVEDLQQKIGFVKSISENYKTITS